MPLTGNAEIPLIAYWNGNPTGVSMSELNIPQGTMVIDFSTPAIWLKTSTTDNSGFTGGAGNALTAPLITGGLTAAGSASNNFSGSTGAFQTSSGTNTLNGIPVIPGVQALSGAGAVNVTAFATEVTNTGTNALTLANGTAGQLKAIVYISGSGTSTLTPTTKTGYSTIAFSAVGQSVLLQYYTTLGWMILSNNGATAS